MKYRVTTTPHANRCLSRLDIDIQSRIIAKVVALAENPHPPGSLKMVDASNTSYRIRIGDYRAIYEIHDAAAAVIVTDIDHRSDIYRHRHG